MKYENLLSKYPKLKQLFVPKLAKLLHVRGFHITFVNTEYNHKRLLKSRGSDSLNSVPSFQFETIPDGLSVTSGLSAFQKLYGCVPYYSSLKVFGSTYFVLRPRVERSWVFLGYEDGKKGYRYYDTTTQKLYVSRHVVFLEHIPFYSRFLSQPYKV